ncbi:MAG: hypothetical protein HRT86_02475 [Ilumatobacteraceae bacterium]|nr:hypothetical protein [Ilumatobacteraceae bacterium]
MSRRALPALVVVLVAMISIVIAARTEPVVADPVFSTPAGDWMPSVTETEALTGSWFCPGVPATGEDGVGGEVVVANRDGDPMEGQFTVLTPDGPAAAQDFMVEPWSTTTIDVDAFSTVEFASVVVETEGGRGIVEQRAIHPAGESVAPCANDASDTWYLADGFTVDGSVETLLVTNPYDEPATARLRFATESGEFTPGSFQGFVIQPQSVEVIRLAEGVLNEPVIAVELVTESGRVVLGRAQHYVGGGRLGYDVSLAAPALRDQWWFADGEVGEGISETFAIYNPTDDDVTVDVVFLGVPIEANFGDVEPIEVAARSVVVYDPSSEDDGATLPEGRHAVVFSTLSDPSIVVERVLTRPAGDSVATSVVLGAPPRSDGFVASRWHIGIGPSSPAPEALVIYNVDNGEGAITVRAVGPGGPTEIDGLTDVPIGAAAVITIDLEAADALDSELIVDATNRVFVERRLPRGAGLEGTSGSWAIPSASS